MSTLDTGLFSVAEVDGTLAEGAQYTLADGDAQILGDFSIFTNRCTLSAGGSPTFPPVTLAAPLPRWWRVRCLAANTTINVTVDRTALVVCSQRPLSGVVAIDGDKFDGACSLPAPFFNVTRGRWLAPRVYSAVPGDLIFAASVSASGGSRGFVSLGAVPPQAVYCVYRITPPQGATTDPTSAQGADALYAAVQRSSDGNHVAVGDLSAFFTGWAPFTVLLLSLERVNEVGYWQADALQYATRVECNVYGISAAKRLPGLANMSSVPGQGLGSLSTLSPLGSGGAAGSSTEAGTS